MATRRSPPDFPLETCAARSPNTWSGVRTLLRMMWCSVWLGCPRSKNFSGGIQRPSFVDVPGAGADAITTDIGMVDRRAHVGDQAAVLEDGRQQRDVEEMPCRQPGVVGDDDITVLECAFEHPVQVSAGSRERIDVAWCSRVCLGHHTPACVEQCAGQVTGFAHDRTERDALQAFRLLADDADQVGPEYFKFDAVHGHSFLCRYDAAEIIHRCRPSGQDDDRGFTLLDDHRTIDALVDGQRRPVIDRHHLIVLPQMDFAGRLGLSWMRGWSQRHMEGHQGAAGGQAPADDFGRNVRGLEPVLGLVDRIERRLDGGRIVRAARVDFQRHADFILLSEIPDVCAENEGDVLRVATCGHQARCVPPCSFRQTGDRSAPSRWHRAAPARCAPGPAAPG